MRSVVVLSLVGLLACKDEEPEPEPSCLDAPGCVVAEDLPAGLLSVRVVAEDDVWIVGASPDPADGTGPAALRFDGASWTRLDTSAWDGAELWWAWVDADEAVLVGSQGLILDHDRSSGALEAVPGIDAGTTFFGVWGADPDDLWAVGSTGGGSGPPALWRRQQGTWAAWEDATLGPGADGTTYFKVHGTSASDVWIVGTQGTVLHFDGTALTAVPTEGGAQSAPLLTVDAGGDGPVAVGGTGNGLVLSWDGSVWNDRSPAFVPGFNGVCLTDGAGWAVGQYGLWAVQQPDGSWQGPQDHGLASLTQEDWHACAVSPAGAVWAVGGAIAARPLNRGVIAVQGREDVPAPPL